MLYNYLPKLFKKLLPSKLILVSTAFFYFHSSIVDSFSYRCPNTFVHLCTFVIRTTIAPQLCLSVAMLCYHRSVPYEGTLRSE